MKRISVALTAVLFVSTASAHENPIQVTTANDGAALALLGQARTGVLINAFGEIATESPGFGVDNGSLGPPGGTVLQLNTLSGLLYWDGVSVVPTEATLTIEAPVEDSLGRTNQTRETEYFVDQGASPQIGVTWGVVSGFNGWDAHGFYTLATDGGTTPATGVYAVQVELDSPTHDPSEPFLLSFALGLNPIISANEITAGLDAIIASLASDPIAGDYDGSTVVDAGDLARWFTEFGTAEPGASSDGNGDNSVTAADYVYWRDHLPPPTGLLSPIAIPEPTAIVAALLGCLSIVVQRSR